MKKLKLLKRPTRLSELSFDQLYDDLSNDLDTKIERFLKRHRRLQED